MKIFPDYHGFVSAWATKFLKTPMKIYFRAHENFSMSQFAFKNA